MRPEPRTPSQAPLSHVLMVRLQQLPRLLVPGLVLVLALVGFMAPPVVAALGLLLALLAFLATFSWGLTDRRGRLLRMIAMGVLAGLLIARAYELLA